MPRVKIPETEIANRRTRAAITHNMEYYGITEQEMAKALHCTVRTIQNKRNRPESMSLPDIRAWAKLLKFTDEQLIEFVGVLK